MQEWRQIIHKNVSYETIFNLTSGFDQIDSKQKTKKGKTIIDKYNADIMIIKRYNKSSGKALNIKNLSDAMQLYFLYLLR